MPITRVEDIDRGGARTDNPPWMGPNAAPGNTGVDLTRVIPSPEVDPTYGEQRQPIGVPPGYGASYGEPGGNILSPSYMPTGARPPRYFAGDEWIPANYPVERRIQIQQDLFEAGLLDLPYQKEEWDANSRRAYAAALARANASGTTYDQTITELKANVARYGRPTDQRQLAPGVIELTNPDQISNLANEVAVRVLGRRLDPAQAQHFAATYNQLEREYQQQVYNMRLQGAANTIAGEVTQPPSLDSFGTQIASQVKEENPQDASLVTTLNAADIFFDMLRSSRL